jgi:hypothetical protein
LCGRAATGPGRNHQVALAARVSGSLRGVTRMQCVGDAGHAAGAGCVTTQAWMQQGATCSCSPVDASA